MVRIAFASVLSLLAITFAAPAYADCGPAAKLAEYAAMPDGPHALKPEVARLFVAWFNSQPPESHIQSELVYVKDFPDKDVVVFAVVEGDRACVNMARAAARLTLLSLIGENPA